MWCHQTVVEAAEESGSAAVERVVRQQHRKSSRSGTYEDVRMKE